MREVRHWLEVLRSTRLLAVALVIVSAHPLNQAGNAYEVIGEEPMTALSVDGKRTITTLDRGGELILRDNTGKNKPVEVEVVLPGLNALAVTPDGGIAVLGGGGLRIVHFTPKPTVQKPPYSGFSLEAVAISPDGKMVAGGGKAKKIVLLDAATGKVQRTLTIQEKWVSALRFTPDGSGLVYGTKKGKCGLLALATGKVVWSVKAHTDQVSSIAFFPGGKQIVSGSWDSRIHIADAKTGRTTSAFRAHRKSINEVAVSPDGKYIGSCCTQGILEAIREEFPRDQATFADLGYLNSACLD